MTEPFDIVIVGGGVGGCAAAIAASDLGLRVALTEETYWLGGQLTSQATPPDEHRWVEAFGRTRRYRAFRDKLRAYYRENYPLTQEARDNPTLNPGGGTVSRLCIEPRAAVSVIEQMMAYSRSRGGLHVFLRRKPLGASIEGDHVESVRVLNLDTGTVEIISGTYFLDATELGDLLQMAHVEYVSGSESRDETGELHASPICNSNNVQALTWCMAAGYDRDGEHVIDKPAMYDFWKGYYPEMPNAPWSGPLLSWTYTNPFTLEPTQRSLFGPPDWQSLFGYRQIVDGSIYSSFNKPHDVTVLNWPQNDYFLANVIDVQEDIAQKALSEARDLTLSLFYWLQTEAPRPDGGQGYPGLYPRGDIVGTKDGLAMAPYYRESRRIRAVRTIKEEHVGAQMLSDAGLSSSANFPDSVGTGYYRIDLHPTVGGDNYIDIESKPFQIPLGALVPVRVQNLLPACKNIGTTHVTNGCYRLHPVEWNIGEAAGLTAAFSLLKGVTPYEILEKKELFEELAALLDNQGIERAWPAGF